MERKLTYKDVVEYSQHYVKFKNGKVVTYNEMLPNFACPFGSNNKSRSCRCYQCRVVKFFLNTASMLDWAHTKPYDARLVNVRRHYGTSKTI